MQIYRLKRQFYLFHEALFIWNRKAELKRLIRWARNKQLEAPLRLYQHRMSEHETKLLRLSILSPKICTWAYRAHLFGQAISPTPRYLAKGSASVYQYSHSPRKSLLANRPGR